MAKQSVNIVERHIEKALLAICAAVLLSAIVLYVVSTPNTADLSGEIVRPNSIDEHIRDAGRALRDRFQGAQPDEVEVVDFVPQLQAASSTLAYANLEAELASPTPHLPPVPDIGDAPPRVGEIRLASVVAPSKPMVTTGRSTLSLAPPVPLGVGGGNAQGAPIVGGFETDVNWVTIAAQFDQQHQITVCKNAGYKAGRRNPYVAGIDLQRRERLVDGTYGDWIDVKSYVPAVLPSLPQVDIVEGRKGPIATEATRERISAFFSLLRNTQPDLFRPMFPTKVHGDEWLYPKFDDTDIPALDRELCNPLNPGACEPRDYPTQTDLAPAVVDTPKTETELIEDALLKAQSLFQARQWKAVIDGANEIKKMPGVRTNHIQQADRLIDDARQGQLDEERNPPARDDDDDTEDTVQRRSRYQVVWAHDAEAAAGGGAVSGRTYQYRLRVKLYNRYCAVPADLADQADAERVFAVGQWSPPSDDVETRQDTEFFLTSGSTNTESGAKVTVFKWYKGVWVSHGFPIEIGEPMGKGAREPFRVLKDGRLDRPLVDFHTGNTVVDIDYDYVYRARRRKGREGFTVESPKPTVAVVYLDRDGALRQRVLAADRLSRGYKQFKEIVFEPPRP